MKPYYEDDLVTLYHGDSLQVLPKLDVTADVLLTDPPYFKVKQDEWDNQWDKSHEFLSWLGSFLDTAKPLLAAHASVWVFASPAMTSSVERLVGERFRVLNSIRWVKEAGWHQKAELAAMRAFLTPWEGIIFAEQAEHFGRRITKAREAAGRGMNEVDLAMGRVRTKNPERGTELCRRWEEGTRLPTRADYERLRDYLGHTLLPVYEEFVRPFTITNRAHSTDVWSFPTVAPYPGKHPCEKPESMLRHMVEVSTRPGGLVLDPFAGSGSTLEAARNAGRRAVGIEKDARYCEQIAVRLSQGVLSFGA